MVAGMGRSEASTQTAPASGSRVAAIAGGAFEGARAGASQRPALGQSWRGRCGRAWGHNVGPSGRRMRRREVHVGRQRGRWQFVRSSARQQQISLRQPRAQPQVQQPTVSRMDAGSDDAPMAQQQSQPRPQVRSRPIQRPFWSRRRVFASNASAQRERHKRQAKAAKASETGAILQRASAGSADPRSRACLTPLVGRTTNSTTRY